MYAWLLTTVCFCDSMVCSIEVMRQMPWTSSPGYSCMCICMCVCMCVVYVYSYLCMRDEYVWLLHWAFHTCICMNVCVFVCVRVYDIHAYILTRWPSVQYAQDVPCAHRYSAHMQVKQNTTNGACITYIHACISSRWMLQCAQAVLTCRHTTATKCPPLLGALI